MLLRCKKCSFLSDFEKMVYQLNYRPECLEVAILASKVASTLNIVKINSRRGRGEIEPIGPVRLSVF